MSCPSITYSREQLATLERADGAFFPKSFAFSELRYALDGSDCQHMTRDGVARGEGGRCIDLGTITHSDELDAIGAEQPLVFLPDAASRDKRAPAWTSFSAKLHALLREQQFGGQYSGCGVVGAPAWRSMYFVNTVPLIGFGSIIEYGILYLVRATHLNSQLVLGQASSRGWTSSWFCGNERSLNCYFNLTSCCGRLTMGEGAAANPVELSRRRNPISIGLPRFNAFGSVWVSAQLAHFFFSHLTPRARQEVDRRRASVFPRRALVPDQPRCIGMHIRGGDACHARRYCPANLTSSFFAMAAKMRARYGLTRLVLATDNERAAQLCAQGVLGFDCRTLKMARAKFDDPAFIESRVSRHEDGTCLARGTPPACKAWPPACAWRGGEPGVTRTPWPLVHEVA